MPPGARPGYVRGIFSDAPDADSLDFPVKSFKIMYSTEVLSCRTDSRPVFLLFREPDEPYYHRGVIRMNDLIDTRTDRYVVTCESPCDLGTEYMRKIRVPFACFHIYINDAEYPDDCGDTLSPETFYGHMEAGDKISTSQINPQEYRDLWAPYLEKGLDIVHLTTSSGISGTYNSAVIAADNCMEEFAGRKVYVTDSKVVSAGYGLFVDKLAEKRDEGLTAEELHVWAEKNKFRLHFWFYAGKLKYLVAGGRVSKTSAFFGKMLKICPVLYWNQNGQPIHFQNVRTMHGANAAMVARMEAEAAGGLQYADKCFISHSVAPEAALDLKNQISEKFSHLKEAVRTLCVGPTIGNYTGPSSLSIAFWSAEEKPET